MAVRKTPAKQSAWMVRTALQINWCCRSVCFGGWAPCPLLHTHSCALAASILFVCRQSNPDQALVVSDGGAAAKREGRLMAWAGEAGLVAAAAAEWACWLL